MLYPLSLSLIILSSVPSPFLSRSLLLPPDSPWKFHRRAPAWSEKEKEKSEGPAFQSQVSRPATPAP